jgi:phosphonoacetaldehyde hydrolase
MAEAATRHAVLIPGAAALVADLREQGVKVGSGTGYTREMMQGILTAAAEQGYAPDVVVCAGETPSGRPAPLMTWKALIEMDAWPASACVKVDDAEVGVAEGRASGCWSIGLAASGNGVGLSPDAWRGLSETRRRALRDAAETSLRGAGAHYVVDSVADLGPTLAEIASRIAAGEKP